MNPLVTCLQCPACLAGRENLCAARQIISMPPREGAFAQYVTMRDSNLVAVPDGFSIAKASLAEPLAVSWHAARLALEALHPSMDKTALVLGGGAIGLAQATGTYAIVIDAVGFAATREAASAAAHPGGVIAHVGLGEDLGGLDVRRMTLQEITFIGTYTYTAQDFRDTAAAIFDRRLGALDWVEHRALADGQHAFQDLRAGQVASPKIILNPWG